MAAARRRVSERSAHSSQPFRRLPPDRDDREVSRAFNLGRSRTWPLPFPAPRAAWSRLTPLIGPCLGLGPFAGCFPRVPAFDRCDATAAANAANVATTEEEEEVSTVGAPPTTQEQAAASVGQRQKQPVAPTQPAKKQRTAPAAAPKQPPAAAPKQPRAKRSAPAPAPPAPAKVPRPPPKERVVVPPAPKRGI